MRLYPVFLATAALFINSHIDSLATAEAKTLSIQVNSQNVNNPAGRWLRTAEGGDESGEERASIINTLLLPKGLSKKVSWVKSLTTVDKIRVKTWLVRRKSIESVFKSLNFHGGIDSILRNPKANLYAAYVELYNAANPTKKLTMLDLLLKKYDLQGVLKLLEQKTNVDRTWYFTTNLMQELAYHWVNSGKSAEKVFSLLGLSDKNAVRKIFMPQKREDSYNGMLLLYCAYTQLFNIKYPSNQMKMIDEFNKIYGVPAVANMIESGVRVPGTNVLAESLRAELFSLWTADHYTAEDVCKVLRLDQKGWGLSTTPVLELWHDFIQQSNEVDPIDTMLDILVELHGYDKLSRTFVGVDPKMASFMRKKRKLPVFNDIMKRMMTRWLDTDTPPSEVAKLLKLKDHSKTNSNRILWMQYQKLFGDKQEKRANDRAAASVPDDIDMVLKDSKEIAKA